MNEGEQQAATLCNHDWRTCPVHADGGERMPGLKEATTCIYGGAPTVDGDGWDEHDSEAVWDRVFKRLED